MADTGATGESFKLHDSTFGGKAASRGAGTARGVAMIAWALETMIMTSALLLLVLALRRPVATTLGSQWAYALWLLPLARLVMPPLPFFESQFSVVPREIVLIPTIGEPAAPPPSIDGPGQWVLFMLATWAGGAVVFILWQLLSYRKFLSGLSAGMRRAAPMSYGGIPVIESEAAEGPLAVGILDRRIAVPPLFEFRYTPEEQELALRHELVHHQRGDLFWNLAALFVLALNWFNPLAYMAFRAFREDQELACDAAVMSGAPERCGPYANALIKSASRPGLIAACPLNHADQLKRRLKMMKRHRSSRARTCVGSAVTAMILAGGLGFSAPSTAAQNNHPQGTHRELPPLPPMSERPFVRAFDGKPGELAGPAPNACDGDNRFEVKLDDTNRRGNMLSFMLCNEAGTNEGMIQQLESALARVSADRVPQDHRAQIETALRAEIARRKAL